MEKFKEKQPMRIVRIIVYFFMILAFAYFIYAQFFLPNDTQKYDLELISFNEEWYEIKADGSRKKLTLPANYEDHIVMEAVLPQDIGLSNCYMELRGEKTEVYIDDELRISFDNSSQRAFSKEVTEAYIMAQLFPEDAGKTVRVEMSSMSGILYPVKIGSLFAIWHEVFRLYSGELLIAVLTLFLAVLAILCCLFLKKSYGQITPLIYLSFGICTGALWIICNSALRGLYFNNIGMATDMTFIMIMLTPFFIMFYLNELQHRRYEIAYFIASVVQIIVFAGCTVLHVSGLYDYHDTFSYISIGCFIAIAMTAVTIFVDIFKGKMKEYLYVAIGLLCVVVASSLQLISYSFRNDSFSGEFLSIGMMLMLMFAVMHTIKEVNHMMELKREAEVASEAKGQFLANMSHEIRTPINAVLGMNEMILRETKEEQIKEYATDIKAAGSSLLSLVNDILDFSKIEAGKMDLIPVEYDFSNLIYAVIIMTRPKAEGKGLEFRLEIDKTLPKGLFGDDVRLRQIILNILSNAVKYTEEGSITFSISGYHVLKDIILEISIADTGIGIKEEDKEKLYSEFERFDQSKNHMVEGTGLGMSITHRLLAMMDSNLKVESEYGKGSCFSFKVRQQVVDNSPIGEITAEGRKNKEKAMQNFVLYSPESRILVVDDKDINRKVFCSLVKKTGMQVDQAGSGAKCLELVKNNHYDIVFLDHMMPEMDGIETLHKMKEMPEFSPTDTKVIVLTANAIKGAREHYIEEGFEDYISKPIIPEDLRELLRKYLKSYKEIPSEELLKMNSAKNADSGKLGIDNSEVLKNTAGQEGSLNKDFENKQDGVQDLSGSHAKENGMSMEADGEDGTHNGNDDIQQSDLSVWELMSQISELDVLQAAAFNPDEEMMEEVLVGFYQAIDADADFLENMYGEIQNAQILGSDEKEEYCSEYRVRVHSVKSSAKMIGAMKLSEEAFELEQAARDQDIDIVLDKTPDFLEHFRKYKEYLNFVEKKQNADAQNGLDAMKYKDVLISVLQMLQDAMEDLDVDKADGIIVLLNQYSFPEELKEEIQKLGVAVGQLDIPATEEIVKKLQHALKAN